MGRMTRGTTQIRAYGSHSTVGKGTDPRLIAEHSESGKGALIQLFSPPTVSLRFNTDIFFRHSDYIIY